MIEVASRNLAKAGCNSPRGRLPPAAGIQKDTECRGFDPFRLPPALSDHL